MDSPRKIAVLLPNWVGDVVMATPALRALRGHFPDAHITYVGRAIALDVLEGCPWADAALADTTRQKPRWRSFLRQAGTLRAGGFDLALLLPNSFRTAALVWLAGVPRRVGYDRDGRGGLLTGKLPPRRRPGGRYRPMSALTYYLNLVATLGVHTRSRRMELPVAPGDQARADALLAEAEAAQGGRTQDGPIVMLNPGASFGPSKMWEPARYAALADLLIETHRARIVINAAPSERAIAAEVGRLMRCTPLLNFADRDNTLGLLKALAGRCALLVTNDTGARHVAAAMGIGVVTLFGSTDPRWAEIHYAAERQVRVQVPCSPCQSKMCLQPAGPKYHQCMTAISPQSVLAACEEVLAVVAAGEGASA